MIPKVATAWVFKQLIELFMKLKFFVWPYLDGSYDIYQILIVSKKQYLIISVSVDTLLTYLFN